MKYFEVSKGCFELFFKIFKLCKGDIIKKNLKLTKIPKENNIYNKISLIFCIFYVWRITNHSKKFDSL